ncbi:hypothetical protein IAU60_003801 [Kwoniella sp. DSM 27419]
MPDLLTPQALATAGPLVMETLFKHFLGPKASQDKGKAREDLMYDEAFVIMKTFLEIATKYPCAALQRFGQVRTPSPPWVAVHRVLIPQSTLHAAADKMIAGLGGEEMAYKIAGGTKWWQVRAGRGLEAEWIVMKKDWKEVVAEEKREQEEWAKAKEDEGPKADGTENGGQEGESSGEFRPEMDRLRCMLYIHGGAYYWGSINTHRYTIWRYARKMHGRCFAVNYRKTPQYPFPCAIHDCLAAYMYLVNPPPEAKHRPVDPKSIILAGDSAGGGLVLALLQILRDTEGLELPAGAVLISPWSDLTHSFPSILQNTATDIVPPYGFIHSRLRSRVKEAVSKIHHHPHRAAAAHELAEQSEQRESMVPAVQDVTTIPDQLKTSDPRGGLKDSDNQSESDLHPMANKSEAKHPAPQTEPTHNPHRANPALLFPQLVESSKDDGRPSTLAQCTIPLKLEVKGEEVLVDTQIQLYATNAQLCHPWVSPVLAYLGGLPPLFVMCGDKEVLRDEIIFLAHKAANPAAFPLRDDVKAMLPSMKGIEDRYGPTNVHLQVYDGTCHDLPLLSMTRPARGAFRAIAAFARYVTPSAPGSRYISRSRYDTPARTKDSASQRRSKPGDASASAPVSGSVTPKSKEQAVLEAALTSSPKMLSPRQSGLTPLIKRPSDLPPPIDVTNLGIDVSEVTASPSTISHSDSNSRPVTERNSSYRSNVSSASSAGSESGPSTPNSPGQRRSSILPMTPQGYDKHAGSSGASGAVHGDEAGPRFEQGKEYADDVVAKEGEAGWPGIYRGNDPFTDHMIRERVTVDGILRPLEPASELSGMQMPLDEVGYIKEGPAMRYLNGQALWDKKYRRAAKTVQRKREKNLKIAHKEGGKIGREWIKRAEKDQQKKPDKSKHHRRGDEHGSQSEGGEDLDVADQSWSWTWALNGEAPPPSAVVSRRDFAEARQLALMADRLDSSHDTSFHGLSIWVGLAGFFSSSTERNKAGEVIRAVRDAHHAQKWSARSRPQTGGKEDDPWADESDEGEQEQQQELEKRRDGGGAAGRARSGSRASRRSAGGTKKGGKWFSFLRRKKVSQQPA